MAQTVRTTRAEDMPKKPGRKVLDASRRSAILVPSFHPVLPPAAREARDGQRCENIGPNRGFRDEHGQREAVWSREPWQGRAHSYWAGAR